MLIPGITCYESGSSKLSQHTDIVFSSLVTTHHSPGDRSGAELGFKSENMYARSSPRGPELATRSVRAEHRRYNYRGRLSFSAAGAVVSAYLPLRSSATVFHTALPQSCGFEGLSAHSDLVPSRGCCEHLGAER